MSSLISAIARELVGRFVIGERRLELALPVAVGGKAMPGLRLRAWPAARASRRPGRDRRLGGLLLLDPRLAAELGERRAASWCRRRTSAPGRSSTPARRASCRRRTRSPGALRAGLASRAAACRDSGRCRGPGGRPGLPRGGRGTSRSPCPGGGAAGGAVRRGERAPSR